MNRILTLLIPFLIPMSLIAQETYTSNIADGKYILDKSESNRDRKIANSPQFWLNIGPGIGTSGPFSGIVSASYQFGENLLSLRSSTTGELFGDHFADAGLLYGRASARKSYHLSFAAGIARVTGQRSEGNIFSGSTEDVSPTVGLPVELQCYWKPVSFLGIGLTGYTNINTEQSFAGFALGLQVGKLR